VEIIKLLVVETKRNYHEYLDGLDEGPSPLPSVTEAEMLVLLAIIIMGQCIQDKLAAYWVTTNQFHTSFYSSAMKRDRYTYLHILSFLHFAGKNDPGMKDKNSARLWKIRYLFVYVYLNKTTSKIYSRSAHLAID